MLKRGMGVICFVSIMTASAVALGQESATTAGPAAPAVDGSAPASGLMIQARMQTQANLLSMGSGSSFLLGYRGPSYAVGLGLGVTRIGGSIDDDKASATLFHVMPTAMIDVWQSADGRARANLIGGVGYGRATLSAETSYEDCIYDPTAGADTCSTSTEKATASASLVPLLLGFGGDYFLSRNFALGAEGGLQGAFVFGLKSKYEGETTDQDGGANTQLVYGVVRATFVLGN